MKVQLTAKSQHGKNRLREAGNPNEWEVLEEKENRVLIRVEGKPDTIRWVWLQNDRDFFVAPID